MANVTVIGAVTEDDGAPVDPQVCSWLLDDRPVARGTDGWIVAPAPGDHRCTFIVRGRGGTARAEVTLRTLDPSETDPRQVRGEGEPTTVVPGPLAAAADRPDEEAESDAAERGGRGRYVVTRAAVVPGGR